MVLEFGSMSSQVVAYEDLSYHMRMDIEDKNEYYMNQNMVEKYFDSIGLTLDPSKYIYDYYKLQVYVKIISYNAQTRAYNGFFAMLSLLSILLMLIDFTNFIIYVPILNCCAALQLGHLFTIYESRRSYIGIIAVFVVYFALYLWGAWT